MKISILSDLHLEFHRKTENIKKNERIWKRILPDHTEENGFEADVIVLAGDIHVGLGASDFIKYILRQTHNKKTDVIYILGNHEFYYNDFKTLVNDWRVQAELIDVYSTHIGDRGRFYFLERDKITIDDTEFIGCTLWTDMDNGDPNVKMRIQHGLNDYNYIKYDGVRVFPEDVIKDFEKSEAWLFNTINKDKKQVVITHHSPSLQLRDDKYFDDLSFAYHANLDNLIQSKKPKLWINGHLHYNYDTVLDETRVICNCAGYPNYAEVKDYNKNLIIEI